jgi:hypothetical protein
LSSDCICNDCNELFVDNGLLLTVTIVHGYVPDDMVCTTITPVPRGKSTNVMDCANYRGITLSSITGKILDCVILIVILTCYVRQTHSLGL